MSDKILSELSYDSRPEEELDSIFGHLAMRQTEFEESKFFEYLRTNPPTKWMGEFIPKMGFWVHTFQDVIQLIERQVTDPVMKSIAMHIREGDIGHDDWFGRDMQKLGLSMPSLSKVYGDEHKITRMASYAILSEVFRVSDDRLLVVLLLTLESASYVFFEDMTQYLEGNDFAIELKYFGRNHLEAELEHGIVEAEMDRCVENAISKSRKLQAEALALIDRVFDAFTEMFDSFVPASFVPTAAAPDAKH